MKTLIFDWETTGLIDNRSMNPNDMPEAIEFYGCVVDLDDPEGGIIDELDTLIRPKADRFDPIITRITGLTPEKLIKAPRFAEVADRVLDLIMQSDQVLAHNCSFDVEMTEIEFQRIDQTIRWPRKICTVEQTLHIKGKRLSLSALHEYLFGEKFDGAHRARVDVMALVRCARELKKREMI